MRTISPFTIRLDAGNARFDPALLTGLVDCQPLGAGWLLHFDRPDSDTRAARARQRAQTRPDERRPDCPLCASKP